MACNVTASSGEASPRMSRQRSRDTAAELAVRRELFRLGLRYRVHRRPLANLRRVADVVFPTERVAVFVDGCFWHGCPDHRTHPQRNAEFWRAKIDGNIARDKDTDAQLLKADWVSVRIWEHEDPKVAVRQVELMVRDRKSFVGQAPASPQEHCR